MLFSFYFSVKKPGHFSVSLAWLFPEKRLQAIKIINMAKVWMFFQKLKPAPFIKSYTVFKNVMNSIY